MDKEQREQLEQVEEKAEVKLYGQLYIVNGQRRT